MSWKNYEFKCEKCDGHGTTMCSCCDSEKDCEACDGEGIDRQVDLARMRQVEQEMYKANPNPATCGSWELVENDVWVGRTNGIYKLYYRDFLKASAVS